jgi:signal transduction histidine kinase
MISRKELYERWALGWRLLAALSFLVVGFAVAAGMPAGWPGTTRFWLLFAGLIVWYAGSIAIGRERLYQSLPLSLGYFAIGWALWAPLLALHEAAYAFAAFFFPLTYSHLPTKRAIVFALVATGLMFVHGTDFHFAADAGTLLGGGLGVISAIMLALFINSIITQSEERRRLIQELEATRSSLAAAERQAGILEERQRIAQEVHDSVAQGFVGIVTHLEAAESSLDGMSPAATHVAAAKGSARESLAAARRLVWDLRPDLVGKEPLPAALQELLGGWRARVGDGGAVTADLIVTGTPRMLDAPTEAALLQAAREALNNVRTHARATRVTVRVAPSPAALSSAQVPPNPRTSSPRARSPKPPPALPVTSATPTPSSCTSSATSSSI